MKSELIGRVPVADFRQPPHNLEAEQALLGAILVNNEALDRVSGFLSPQHFFDPLHGRIYETLATLIHAGKTATPITVKTFFENAEPIDANMSVPQYLGRLAANATTIINAAEYGRTIYDLATRRSLILIGEDMVNTAYESAVDQAPRAQIEEAEGRLYSLAEHGNDGHEVASFREIAAQVVHDANEAYRQNGSIGCLLTGFGDIDDLLGGLQKSDLIILAGRPSMGKTALAAQIAYNIAKAHRGKRRVDGTIETVEGGRVGFFSLEMSNTQIVQRIIAMEAGISAAKVSRGQISEDDIARLMAVQNTSQEVPFYINQKGGITIAQLTSWARRMKRQYGISLVVIDYLQLLRATKSRNDNRVQEITQITGELKALAKELDLPIIGLSQLSRRVDERENKRPLLSDLRDSGSIEQDADVVMFVFREEYYLERLVPDPGDVLAFGEYQKKLMQASGKAEIIVAKQRRGPIGTVKLHFDSELTRFSGLSAASH